MKNKKATVYFILGSGGHTRQMMLLQEKFDSNNYEKIFICSKTDYISQRKVKNAGNYNLILVTNSRETGINLTKEIFRNIFSFSLIKQLYEAILIVKKMRKSLVITAGPSTGFLVYILAFITNNYCVYIESWSRVKKLSLSGKIYKRFSRLFFVQWEELSNNNNKFIYKGRLL